MSLMYKKSMNVLDKLVPKQLQPLWQHPAGKEFQTTCCAIF